MSGKNMKIINLIKFLIIITFLSSSLHAADDGHDHDHAAHSDEPFYGHVGIRVHADHVNDAGEGEEEVNEYYTHSHVELGSRIAEGFNIDTNLKIEGEPGGHGHGGIARTHDGETRVFEDHPLIVESLTLTYSYEDFSVYLGKFNPKVGLDYHSFPGLYSYSMIEEYKIAERIGAGVKFGANFDDFGTHQLNVSGFHADTTFLSDAILDSRGHTSKSDGGLANTEDFDSYAISLGGKDFYSLDNNIVERLSYRFGYALQKAGIGNEEDEARYSLSLSYRENFSDKISKTLIFEYMDIEHYSGEEAHDRSYFTSSLGLELYPYSFSTTYTFVDNDAPEEEDEDHDGKILQISVGYAVTPDINISFGFKRADEENEVNERFGLGFKYAFEL
tara:strand:- start:2009 stop:3175 length:1167 start_codon:yes stop_codon:yes gene_type:complete